MQVIVDEQTYAGVMSANQTIQQLADDVCTASAGQEQRLVVGLACDGLPVAPEQFDRVLRTPVEDFELVEMQTVSVREQIQETLAQALDTLSRTHPLREAAADLLSQGRHEAAMGEIQKILEILKQVQQTTLLTSHLLKIDLQELKPGGRNFLDTLTLIKDELGQLKAGMETSDFVMVSDILRYEFVEPLDAWASILRSLQDLAAVG